MKPSTYPPVSEVEFNRNTTHRNRLRSLLNLVIVAVAALASSATLTRAQNVLVDPGFESGYGPWVTVPTWAWKPLSEFSAVQSTNGFVYPSPTEHVSVHGGTNTLKIWGYNQPYTVPDGLMQTLPCAPGSTWAASGWLNTQNPDNMRSTEFAYLEVQFLDSTYTIVGPTADNLSPNLTPASPTNTWTYLEVVDPIMSSTNLVAPGGTAYIRFIMRFSQPSGYPGGSCYFDDLQLVKTSKPDPEITVQPNPATLVYGQTAVFSVVADGQTTLSYKWQKGGADISNPRAYGVNTATLTISNVTLADVDNYTVTVTDQAGPLTSNPAYLTVQDPGVISITPALGQTKTNGGSASFTVSAAGSSPLSYQWQLNGSPLSNNGRIAGATSSALTVANLTAADVGTYNVMINGGAIQASGGLMVVPASQVATNLLNNPGFEYGVLAEPWESDWNAFGGLAPVTTNDFYSPNGVPTTTPVSIYDGTYACEVYVTAADNGGYQANVPVVAGGTYHVGGHFYVSSLDPITGAAWVVLQVMFKDSGGNTIQPTLSSYQIGTNFTSDAWTFIQITNSTGGADLVAPAGTVAATCQVYEYAQAGGGGAVYFDDLYVTAASVQPPPTPVKITPWASGGSMHLAFPSTSGVTYEVLYAGSLASPITWHTNSTVSGTGSVITVSDPIGATPRYYRLLEH